MLLATTIIHYDTKSAVALTIDGKEEVLLTHAKTVGELLEEQDIKLDAHDEVLPAADTKIKGDMEISLKIAKEVELTVDGEKKDVKSTADTVGEVLTENKVHLTEYDKVEPNLDSSIKENLNIKIDRATPLSVEDNGTTKGVYTHATNVSELLEKQSIKLSNLDRVVPSPETAISKDMTINIVRVEQKTDVIEEATSFAVVTKKDSSLTKGNEKVVQEGLKGSVNKHFVVTYENGKEVSRQLEKTVTTKESQDKVIHVGTKVITKSVSRGKPSGGKEFRVTATAYTADCNGCSGVTATGINLNKNPDMKVIAVDPSIIPLGSKVWVEGYGYAVAGDTGGAIKGNKIDLFMNSESQAYDFGRRTVRIKVLS